MSRRTDHQAQSCPPLTGVTLTSRPLKARARSRACISIGPSKVPLRIRAVSQCGQAARASATSKRHSEGDCAMAWPISPSARASAHREAIPP